MCLSAQKETAGELISPAHLLSYSFKCSMLACCYFGLSAFLSLSALSFLMRPPTLNKRNPNLRLCSTSFGNNSSFFSMVTPHNHRLASVSFSTLIISLHHLYIQRKPKGGSLSQSISRGKGKSAVAPAAYRAGQTITNEYEGVTHDYTRKGGVVHTEILLPDNAPAKYSDRAVLWNAVEKIEKAKNAQLAREIEIALPVELTQEQNISLVREYVNRHFVSAGMCADICLHDTGCGNPHAHIMLTMRPFTKEKTWGAKQKKEYILDKDGNKIYDPKKRQYKCKSIPATGWNEQTKAEEWWLG